MIVLIKFTLLKQSFRTSQTSFSTTRKKCIIRQHHVGYNINKAFIVDIKSKDCN